MNANRLESEITFYVKTSTGKTIRYDIALETGMSLYRVDCPVKLINHVPLFNTEQTEPIVIKHVSAKTSTAQSSQKWAEKVPANAPQNSTGHKRVHDGKMYQSDEMPPQSKKVKQCTMITGAQLSEVHLKLAMLKLSDGSPQKPTVAFSLPTIKTYAIGMGVQKSEAAPILNLVQLFGKSTQKPPAIFSVPTQKKNIIGEAAPKSEISKKIEKKVPLAKPKSSVATHEESGDHVFAKPLEVVVYKRKQKKRVRPETQTKKIEEDRK